MSSDDESAAAVGAFIEMLFELAGPLLAWFAFSPWFVFWPGVALLALLGLDCCMGGP